ncbi:MAG: OmpA family protein [Parasporobacterium sp.]|nr:OmpA family protein [Parasporobacterium sp.]
MKLRRNRRKSEDEETSYWLSYSDMMAGLLLVFVLIISFTILQSQTQYEEKTEELAAIELELLSAQSEVAGQDAELEAQKAELESQQAEIDAKDLELESQQAELDANTSALDTLKALLDGKELLLQEQQAQLDAQQEQLDAVIGVRTAIITALRDEFEDTDLKVAVDPATGSITMDSSILFDKDDYTLKPSGEEFLREFLPMYVKVLFNGDFKDYVSEIIIEGHTDTDGTYMHNLELSQQRALAVATLCLDEENNILTPEELNKLKTILTANGRSFSNPIYMADGKTVDMDASRRVEFKFRLNDEEMVQQMIGVLNGEAETDEP